MKLTALILLATLQLTQWQMKSTTAGESEWIDVTVPTTVLSALVDKGVYPDPWIGMNNFTIPDVSEPGSPFRDPYQFRTSFTLPKEMAGAEHIWLHLDGINYLCGKSLTEINDCAAEGTIEAHVSGSVPVVELTVESVDEYTLGQLIYFFEFACGISGYTLGVNPFNQPGVEAYKRNMFRLLGKPGF